MTLEETLERLRARYTERHAEAIQRIERVKAAADAYLVAAEADLAADLAVRAGLDPPRASSALRAVLDLRASVEALPEAHYRDEAATPPIELPARQAPLEPTLTDPMVQALYNAFDAIDFSEMPNDIFRATAEEYACLAREKQDRGAADPHDCIGRIVRRITAFAYARDFRDIFGLSRSHSDPDWGARALRAHRERARLLAAPPAAPRAIGHRITIPDAVRAAVVPPVEAQPETEVLNLPLLKQLTAAKGLVIFGGVVKPDKLYRLQEQFGDEVEWIIAECGQRAIKALEVRAREGRVGAIVFLEDLMSHEVHYKPILEATRQSGVLVAYGGKAGKGTLAQAFTELEAMLARAESAA